MPRRVGTDEPERKVLADIEEFGWHSMNILAEGAEPQYTFTIGLFQTWQFPELLIIGLKSSVAHAMLQIIVNGLRDSKQINLDEPNDDLLDGYACCFVCTPKNSYEQYVGFARWYYEGNSFPLYQIVWPSKGRHFPWNPLANPEYRSLQPVLGQPHVGS
jgi:hypothetical protein